MYIYKSSSAEMGGYIDSGVVRVNSLPFFCKRKTKQHPFYLPYVLMGASSSSAEMGGYTDSEVVRVDSLPLFY